ncbi:carboxylating nicotinate-nucleotide diphosphorylase [Pseudochelatococcus contaminans]|uniref:Probable nicotinate-nucleotide pyrophosphorylase [carboxylating] n=1 Tax=Pseudochelatococcus contaminans TaxID=1538103 RepID=A0A7W5Z4T8_9HYPH|nr:carboxylating nicotinate-nucleotide diphosphorylase [Pseudochelatococcus contaminans]MBB3810175.1 nicotinate-nucleotide pyrophosphorylase (carboxylating) [Pseudochelatococcus contaminans]
MYDKFSVLKQIDGWLAEDIGHVDLTAQLMIDSDAVATFHMNAREPMIVAGIEVAALVFTHYDSAVTVEVLVRDGETVEAGAPLAVVSGPARSLLTAERTALNIVQRLSGIATETARYVRAIAHTRARLLDTRKTTPGLRMLEKHAAVCGGALNHRLGLDSGVMLKDNHIAVCGGIANAVRRAREQTPVLTRIEVECDRLDQVAEAVEAGADVIMLDNMSIPDMAEAVRRVAGRARLEASGGIRLDTIATVAETGVDFISTSRPFQSAPAVDIGLDHGAAR